MSACGYRFHIFYTWAYGMEPRYEATNDEKRVVEIHAAAQEEGSGYRNLRIIEGNELRFEPVSIVSSWRIVRDQF